MGSIGKAFKVLLEIGLCISIFCLVSFIAISIQQRKGEEDELVKIREIAAVETPMPDADIQSEIMENTGEDDPSPTPLETDENMLKTYDFEALRAINPDIIGWIYVPGTPIDYPILKAGEEKQEDYYLKYTYENKRRSCGSIFIRKDTDSTFRDDVSIIYGHNMRSGIMFACLHKYLSGDYLFNNKRVYIYTPDQTISYEIFAGLTRGATLLSYDYPDADTLLDYVYEKAPVLDRKVDVSKNRILSLSTCGNSNTRVVIFAIEKKRIDN